MRTRVDNPELIRVAYMITPFGDGGADRQLLELLRRLDRRRYQPVLFLSDPQGKIVQELPGLNIPIVDLGREGSNETATLRLVPHLRRFQPHVIHSWLFTANTWGRIAGRLARVPAIITSERGMELDRKRIYRWADIMLAPLADRVIVNAHMLADQVHVMQRVPREKIVVIHNGVDAARYRTSPLRDEARRVLGIEPGTAVVGMVGSFKPRKRWDLFLQAIHLLSPRRPLVALAVGDGESRPEIEKQAREMGLGAVVRFLGVRTDMPVVMSALDLLLHTSVDEGLPNVILEAMATGRPVVATDVGGTNEVLEDGVTGYLVPPRSVSHLVEGASRVLDDPQLAASLGRAGQERVEREFTFDACVGRTTNLYESLLRVRSPSGVEVG